MPSKVIRSNETYEDGSCVVHPRRSFYSKYGKRILDIIFGGIGFVITIPFNIVLAILTYFDVGRPIVFSQERIGLNDKPFILYKFRNMTNETDEKGNLLPASQRVTKLGKFVRKVSLDELLQFWLILTGKMSLIGPRPLPTSYLHQYTARHRMRHQVRPGLECPPHSDETRIFSWDDRFENDIWYVENISFKTDIKMAIQMIKLVFNKKNNDVRGDVSSSRGDYFVENRKKH